MAIASQGTYLADLVTVMNTHWPDNRCINIVCHGHSVPAGYFATPRVDSLNAYPHLLYVGLKERYPYAVINVIVTAIGGENSESGLKRFERDVLTHKPDVVTLDYGLNDRPLGVKKAKANWTRMIRLAMAAGSRVILLTPTADLTQRRGAPAAERNPLREHAQQIRKLAAEYGLGIADSLKAFDVYCRTGHLSDLLSWRNHPGRAGHDLVARELMRWFPMQ